MFSSAMYHRHSFHSQYNSASSSSTPAATVFTEDVEGLVAENLISAGRCQRILRKSVKAGIKKQLGRFAKKVAGKNETKNSKKNAARTFRRAKLHSTKWPEQYEFDARVWDRRTNKEVVTKISILLIHELLEVICKLGLMEVICSTENLDKQGKSHLEWMKQQLQVSELFGFGIHGDGIPCNWDKSVSVIMISLSLPGVGGKYKGLRIPLVILPDYAISENTYDDIMEVFAWSMRHALAGSKPVCRHDTAPFSKKDQKRAKTSGADLGFHACLVEARSDWDWLNKCYHFPAHGTVNLGMCWKCNCKRHQVLQIAPTTTPPQSIYIVGPSLLG